MGRFYICRCFFTNNVFLKKINIHVEYHSKEQFMRNYRQILQDHHVTDQQQTDELVKEIEHEIQRRKHIGIDSLERRQIIERCYNPLHPAIFHFQKDVLTPEFLRLVDYCKQDDSSFEDVFDHIQDTNTERTYVVPVLTEEFCKLFLEEVQHFEASSCPKGRPNTMNKYGVVTLYISESLLCVQYTEIIYILYLTRMTTFI